MRCTGFEQIRYPGWVETIPKRPHKMDEERRPPIRSYILWIVREEIRSYQVPWIVGENLKIHQMLQVNGEEHGTDQILYRLLETRSEETSCYYWSDKSSQQTHTMDSWRIALNRLKYYEWVEKNSEQTRQDGWWEKSPIQI